MRDLRGGAVIRQDKLRTGLRRRSMLRSHGCQSPLCAPPDSSHCALSVPRIIRQRETLLDGSDSPRVCHSPKPCDSWWRFSPGANYAKPADPVNLAPCGSMARARAACSALPRAATTSSGSLALALSPQPEASNGHGLQPGSSAVSYWAQGQFAGLGDATAAPENSTLTACPASRS